VDTSKVLQELAVVDSHIKWSDLLIPWAGLVWVIVLGWMTRERARAGTPRIGRYKFTYYAILAVFIFAVVLSAGDFMAQKN
jgi:hypothetical protein